MDILTYINKMNRLYGNEQQVASNPLNIPAHLQHQLDEGQLTPEEFYQHQSIPQSERPLTGAEGGRVYDTRKYLQGGRVEPRVGYYEGKLVKIGPHKDEWAVNFSDGTQYFKTESLANKAIADRAANPIKVKWKEGQKIKLVYKGGAGEQVATDIVYKTPKIEANFKSALTDFAGENKGNWGKAKFSKEFGNTYEKAAAFVRSQNPELIRDTNKIFTQKYKTHLDDLGIKDWASATDQQKSVIKKRAYDILNPYERKGFSVARDQIAKNIPVLDKFEKSGQTLEDFYELVKDRTFKKNLRAYMKGTAGEYVTEAFDQAGIKTKYKDSLPKITDHLEVWHDYENPGTAYKGQLKKAKIKKWSDLHTENMINKAKRVKKTDYANMLDLSHRQDLVIDQNISELGIERPEINRVLIKDAELERNKLHRKNFELVDEIKKGNNVEKNLRLINENNARITKIAELTKGRLTGITINPDTLEVVKLKPSNIMGVDAGILNKSMKDLTVADKKVLRTQILPQIIEEARAMTPEKIASDLSGIMDDPVLSEKLATRMKNLKTGKQITKPVFDKSHEVYKLMQAFCGYGKSAGGRIGFKAGSCPTNVAKRNFLMATNDVAKGRVTGEAAEQIAKNAAKVVGKAGSKSALLSVLGPAGFGLDIAFEVGSIGTDMAMNNASFKEAMQNNWLTGFFMKGTGQEEYHKGLFAKDSSAKPYGAAMDLFARIEQEEKNLKRMKTGSDRATTTEAMLSAQKQKIADLSSFFDKLARKEGGRYLALEQGSPEQVAYEQAKLKYDSGREATAALKRTSQHGIEQMIKEGAQKRPYSKYGYEAPEKYGEFTKNQLDQILKGFGSDDPNVSPQTFGFKDYADLSTFVSNYGKTQTIAEAGGVANMKSGGKVNYDNYLPGIDDMDY